MTKTLTSNQAKLRREVILAKVDMKPTQLIKQRLKEVSAELGEMGLTHTVRFYSMYDIHYIKVQEEGVSEVRIDVVSEIIDVVEFITTDKLNIASVLEVLEQDEVLGRFCSYKLYEGNRLIGLQTISRYDNVGFSYNFITAVHHIAKCIITGKLEEVA